MGMANGKGKGPKQRQQTHRKAQPHQSSHKPLKKQAPKRDAAKDKFIARNFIQSTGLSLHGGALSGILDEAAGDLQEKGVKLKASGSKQATYEPLTAANSSARALSEVMAGVQLSGTLEAEKTAVVPSSAADSGRSQQTTPVAWLSALPGSSTAPDVTSLVSEFKL